MTVAVGAVDAQRRDGPAARLAAPLVRLGARVRRGGRYCTDRLHFLGAVARAALHPPGATRPVLLRMLLNQIRFTAVQALPFVMAIAVLMGVTVLVQTVALAARFGMGSIVGNALAVAVVREIGPLVTAIIVIGRSGTAIAAELATSTVLGETEALDAMGVDPLRFWVVPRVLAVTLSVALLTVYFDVVTVLSGAMMAGPLAQVSLGEALAAFRAELSLLDLWITLGKGAVFGAGTALACSYEGLLAGRRSTSIPQCVTRAVVASLSFVFVGSALFSVILYL